MLPLVVAGVLLGCTLLRQADRRSSALSPLQEQSSECARRMCGSLPGEAGWWRTI